MFELAIQNYICFMLKDNDILNSDIFDFPVYLLLENAQELGTGKNAKKNPCMLVG